MNSAPVYFVSWTYLNGFFNCRSYVWPGDFHREQRSRTALVMPDRSFDKWGKANTADRHFALASSCNISSLPRDFALTSFGELERLPFSMSYLLSALS